MLMWQKCVSAVLIWSLLANSGTVRIVFIYLPFRNHEEPYPDTPDWTAIRQAVDILKEYLRRRPKSFNVIP